MDVEARPPGALGPVSKTLLIPLWARAMESRKRRPIMRDERAAEICEQLDFEFSIFRRAYGTQVGCVVRGLLYDHWVSEFLARHPRGTVVELGAGLSTRFERIDNGVARWIDVDVPEVMALRRAHFAPSARRRLVECSVKDAGFARAIAREGRAPYFFVCEGMLMYFGEAEVRTLLARLADGFGPTELAFDAIAPMVVKHQSLHDSMKHMMDAPFRWGIDEMRDLERWDARLFVREVATLSDIARRFPHRLALPHRVIAEIADRALPRFARSYQICRMAIGPLA